MSLITDCTDNTKKICVQVKRVFDACRKQLSLTDQTVIVNNVSPAAPVLPLTYVGAKKLFRESDFIGRYGNSARMRDDRKIQGRRDYSAYRNLQGFGGRYGDWDVEPYRSFRYSLDAAAEFDYALFSRSRGFRSKLHRDLHGQRRRRV